MDDLLSRKSAEFGIAAARMEITESVIPSIVPYEPQVEFPALSVGLSVN
jgi:hypothetical protein